MNRRIEVYHERIVYFTAIGALGLADVFRRLLERELASGK